MGNNKQISCKICFRVMRSDHLKRHMKVHVKRNETHSTTKIQYNEIDVSALRKMLEKETVGYKNKISLGKALDKILDEGKVMEAVFPKDMQNALNLYRNNMCVEVEESENEIMSEDEIVFEDEKEMNGEEESKKENKHMHHCKDREGYKPNRWDFEMEKYLNHKQLSSNREMY